MLSHASDCGTVPAGQATAAPWLSILLPVYNVQAWLRPCLDSILAQLPPSGVEIILLDDASTDGSRRICEEICAEHPSVRLVAHDGNRGLSAARNSMLDIARGDYVWFLDSDDEMLAGAIAGLSAIVERHAPDLVLCDYRKLGKDYASFLGPTGQLSHDRDALVRGLFASRRMHSWSKIARRSLWGEDLRFPVGRTFEDVWTSPWLLLRARSFYHAGEPWVSYRVRADSITGIVSRTRGLFDDAKNDDLAEALVGFAATARETLPEMSPQTVYAIAQFCAKEFTKISWRLLSRRAFRDRWSLIFGKARRYRAMMEGCSPMPFAELSEEHLRRGRPGRWFVLGLCLVLTRGRTTAGEPVLSGSPV